MPSARLLYGCGSNWYYATKMSVPDPAIWYQDTQGETHVVLSDLEITRGMKEARVTHVHSHKELKNLLQKQNKPASLVNMIAALVEKDNPEEVFVPNDFPSGLFVKLHEAEVPVKVLDGLFFKGRGVKTAAEIELLRTTQHMNQQAFEHAFYILSEAEIGTDNTLSFQGAALTSERLQAEMNKMLLDLGCKGFNGGPIVACGVQGADPHERGHGVLKAHEFIIIDCFPQSENFYNGDLTRTVLKGTPTQWHLDVYAAVKGAQELGISLVKSGANGKDIHAAVMAYLDDAGFPVGEDETGRPFGMFHGTGHSVGLEVHDVGGNISSRDALLEEGHVVTVEPGLYYPGKGGCRMEDCVAVTKNGCDNLTTLKKELIIV